MRNDKAASDLAKVSEEKLRAHLAEKDAAYALETLRRRWHLFHDRGVGDYTDAGCRVLAEHAFRDIPALLTIIDAQNKLLGERAQALAAYWRGETDEVPRA